MTERSSAPWITAPARRSVGEMLGEAVGDVRDVAVGWRWGRRSLVPRSAEPFPAPERPPRAPADWVRRLPVGAARRVIHTVAVKPLLHAELRLDVGGLEYVAELHGPAVIVANHTSHLDTPLLLEALPAARRRRTGVAVTGDYFFDSGWRAGASALAFNTHSQTVPGRGPSRTPEDLVRAGWSVVIFPEGTRSSDGFVREFAADAAALAIEHQVPILPVGIRGSYAAMPRGRAWPSRRHGHEGAGAGPFARSRPRVSVRFGAPMRSADAESAEAFTVRVAAAVRRLIAEDQTTWWQSLRDDRDEVRRTAAGDPPAGSWRRIWEQSQSPEPGGQVRRPKIWR